MQKSRCFFHRENSSKKTRKPLKSNMPQPHAAGRRPLSLLSVDIKNTNVGAKRRSKVHSMSFRTIRSEHIFSINLSLRHNCRKCVLKQINAILNIYGNAFMAWTYYSEDKRHLKRWNILKYKISPVKARSSLYTRTDFSPSCNASKSNLLFIIIQF